MPNNPNQNPNQNVSMTQDALQQLIESAVQSTLMTYQQTVQPVQQPQVQTQQPVYQQPVQPQYQYAPPAPAPVVINQPPVYQQPTVTAADIAQAMQMYANSAIGLNSAQQTLTQYQQQAQLGPMAGMTMMDIMSLPEPIRSSYLQYAANPVQQNPQLTQLQSQIDNLAQMQQMQMWENNRHHSTKHKVVKYGAIAVGVGGVAYAVHKIKHRHDDDKKYELLAHSIDTFVDAKYGKDT